MLFRSIVDLSELDDANVVNLGPMSEESFFALAGRQPVSDRIPRLPFFAVILRQLANTGGSIPTATDLLSCYHRSLSTSGAVDAADVQEIDRRILGERDQDRSTRGCPEARLGDVRAAVESLVSAGYLRRVGMSIDFAHDLFASYAWCSAFDVTDRRVTEVLGSGQIGRASCRERV